MGRAVAKTTRQPAFVLDIQPGRMSPYARECWRQFWAELISDTAKSLDTAKTGQPKGDETEAEPPGAENATGKRKRSQTQ
jgi:hypothetical protein